MAAISAIVLNACHTPGEHRDLADRAAYEILEEKQLQTLGEAEPLTIERPSVTFRQRLMLEQELPFSGPETISARALEEPEHWPSTGNPDRPEAFFPETLGEPTLALTLIEALQVAAHNSRSYQAQKESLFNAALTLDLERFRFDTTFRGMLEGVFTSDQESHETGVRGTAELGVDRTFETGAELSGRLVFDLVRLLSGEGASSLGILADGSITIPLMRGAGRHIVTEPRTQAERNVVYAIHDFEEFRRGFVVDLVDDYYTVLQQLDRIENAEANYQRLVLASRRARRLADAGELADIQVLQAQQDVLRAQDRLIRARQAYQQQLDQFKLTLGLPTDAELQLARAELEDLLEQADELLGHIEIPELRGSSEGEQLRADAPVSLPEPDPDERGRYEIDMDRAIGLALQYRLDLQNARGQVHDAQRHVVVAADALRPGLNLFGSASYGERRTIGTAQAPNARLEPGDGRYSLGLESDIPWSRRAERVGFRRSLVDLDAAVRDAQALEDQVKLQIRSGLRELLQQREDYRIQVQALEIAQRRVRGAELLLEAGRVDIRDVLEAEEALLDAQNDLLAAIIGYRIAELQFQRDLGLLEVDHRGLWEEQPLDRLALDDNDDEDTWTTQTLREFLAAEQDRDNDGDGEESNE